MEISFPAFALPNCHFILSPENTEKKHNKFLSPRGPHHSGQGREKLQIMSLSEPEQRSNGCAPRSSDSWDGRDPWNLLPDFSPKRPVSILGFVTPMVSVVTFQLCPVAHKQPQTVYKPISKMVFQKTLFMAIQI
jgi:hypothetical protein